LDAVALAATIGGSVVALAGVGAAAWGVAQQRASARELATSQHQHERDLARGARLFDRRAEVYERMLAFMQLWTDRIEAIEAIYREGPEPPEPPTLDELNAWLARLRTFGSREVAVAYEGYAEAIALSSFKPGLSPSPKSRVTQLRRERIWRSRATTYATRSRRSSCS
jgi:hypothetical protein